MNKNERRRGACLLRRELIFTRENVIKPKNNVSRFCVISADKATLISHLQSAPTAFGFNQVRKK